MDLTEKTYKKSTKPDNREIRYFKEPIILVIPECELISITNTHYRHTSLLRTIFYNKDANLLERLRNIWLALPIAGAEDGVMYNIRRGVIPINVGKYLDCGEYDSYGQQGSLESVTQTRHGILRRGQSNLVITIMITSTTARGFNIRLLKVEHNGETLIETKKPYM